MPERIQRRRTRGWRMPEGAVYVGRGSRWGNPFRVGGLFRNPGYWRDPACPHNDSVLPIGTYEGLDICKRRYAYEVAQVRDRAHAVALFEPYVRFHDDEWPPALIRERLGGCDLACWCPLDQPCHADVLLRVANAEVTS